MQHIIATGIETMTGIEYKMVNVGLRRACCDYLTYSLRGMYV
jgi:hypothetical protein